MDANLYLACLSIGAYLEWLMKLESESKNMKVRSYSLLLFSKKKTRTSQSSMVQLRAKYTQSRLSLAEY
jgi:hypothetical protein